MEQRIEWRRMTARRIEDRLIRVRVRITQDLSYGIALLRLGGNPIYVLHVVLVVLWSLSFWPYLALVM